MAEDVPRLLVSPHHAGRGAGGHAALHADRLALHGADTEVLRSDCHRGAVCRTVISQGLVTEPVAREGQLYTEIDFSLPTTSYLILSC